ncbi:MAG: hypothetical protein WCY19_04365 [Candidatus Gastranaerophilaceae bacterium]
MINSIPSVSFGTIGAMDKVSSEQLQAPGMYSNPDAGMPTMGEPRRKGGFFRFLGKLILTAVVIGGAAVGARKWINPIKGVDLAEKIEEGAKLSFGKKVSRTIAQFADWIEKTVTKPFNKKTTEVEANPTPDADVQA